MKRSLVFCSLMLWIIADCSGQISSVNNTTSTPVPGSGHDYVHMLNETVNPANGSLSLRIQVPIPKGRGLTLPFSFDYDSGGVWHMESWDNGGMGWYSNTGFLSESGWSYSVPLLNLALLSMPDGGATCSYTSDYVFQDPTGGNHNLGLSNTPSCTATGTYFSGDDFVRASGGGWGGPAVVADADGTVYHYPASQIHWSGSSFAQTPDYVEDRNGNKIVITDYFTSNQSTGTNRGVFAYTDTLGRTALYSSGFGSTGNTVSVSGLAGSYSLTWGTSNANYSAQPVQEASYCIPPPNVSGSQPVVLAISLPNGQSYQFQYDPTYGLINKITYPTGAYVRYVWGLNVSSDAGTWPSTDPNGEAIGCNFQYGTPAVQHRYVSFDGSTEVLRQDFTYSTSWSTTIPSIQWVSKQTIMTTWDLVRGTSFDTDYTYVQASCGPNPPNVESSFANECPVEQSAVYKDWDGSVLRTESKTWIDVNMLSSNQVTLNNGQTTKTTYTYANNNTTALVHEKDEYDYGQGSPGFLLRKTITNYASFPATPLLSDGPYIFDRPCQVITYDGGNARVAEQDFLYDGQAAACGSPGSALTVGVSNLSGHDDTNYAAGSTISRGNVTSAIEQCILLSTGQPCPQRAFLSTSYSYDETGQVISMTDPAGNPPTTYSYANSFTDTTPAVNTNAFLTEIDYPTTGGINHKETFSYAYSDGQLTQSVDQNNQVTSYVYNDALRRLTETDYLGNFGKSVTTYTDTPSAVSVETTRQIDATHSTDVIARYDDTGHLISRSTANGESTPWDRVDTCYDGSGKVKFRSYPYQIGSSTTAPNCTGNGDSSVYDALGRVKTITHSDGSVVSTTYTGRATDVKDEGNGSRLIDRISQVDGLGLLRYVCEVTAQSQQGVAPSACGLDSAGTGFLTSYSYTPLGDLQTVSQGAVSRSFQYDSLSRLTQSSNPDDLHP